MNSLMLPLQGLLLFSCILQGVEGFSPWMKPKGDSSSISERQTKVRIFCAYRFSSKFKSSNRALNMVRLQRQGGN